MALNRCHLAFFHGLCQQKSSWLAGWLCHRIVYKFLTNQINWFGSNCGQSITKSATKLSQQYCCEEEEEKKKTNKKTQRNMLDKKHQRRQRWRQQYKQVAWKHLNRTKNKQTKPVNWILTTCWPKPTWIEHSVSQDEPVHCTPYR